MAHVAPEERGVHAEADWHDRHAAENVSSGWGVRGTAGWAWVILGHTEFGGLSKNHATTPADGDNPKTRPRGSYSLGVVLGRLRIMHGLLWSYRCQDDARSR